jgi:tetratricopeptide (TPR) repeat protein
MIDTEQFIQLLKNDDTEKLYQIYKLEDWHQKLEIMMVKDSIKDINNSSILHFLGWIYEKIDIDLNISMHYYVLSSKRDNSMALNAIGKLYDNDNYVKKNKSLSKTYFELSAKKGNCFAQYNIGLINFNAKKYTEALTYFNLSAEQNHIESCFYLGEIYYYGYGVEQNNTIATKYYKLASKYGSANGHHSLSYMLFYHSGKSVNDTTRALKHIIKALFVNNNDENFESIWYDIKNDNEILGNILTIISDNKRLRNENIELKYRPGGIGYQEAKNDFDSLV